VRLAPASTVDTNATAPAPAADAEHAEHAEHVEHERAADRELLQGHLARAVDLFERVIAEDSEDAAAFRGLGLAQERLGHTAAAVRAYRQALALEPQGAHSDQLRARLQRLESAE
jgi:Flp pilus assembly protein TadD